MIRKGDSYIVEFEDLKPGKKYPVPVEVRGTSREVFLDPNCHNFGYRRPSFLSPYARVVASVDEVEVGEVEEVVKVEEVVEVNEVVEVVEETEEAPKKSLFSK